MAEEKQVEEQPQNGYREALSAGGWVLLLLAIFTFGEYIVGVIAPPWGTLLLIVAAIKAFLVLKDFMHVGRLFSTDEEPHE